MSKFTVTLDVELLTCAVEIIADVGAQLLVHNGVVLGVHAESTNPVPVSKLKIRAPKLPSRVEDGFVMPSNREEAVIALLKRYNGCGSAWLRNRLGINDANTEEARQLHSLLSRMESEGKIERYAMNGQGIKKSLRLKPTVTTSPFNVTVGSDNNGKHF